MCVLVQDHLYARRARSIFNEYRVLAKIGKKVTRCERRRPDLGVIVVVVNSQDNRRQAGFAARTVRAVAEGLVRNFEMPQKLDRALFAQDAADVEIIAAYVQPLALVERIAVRCRGDQQ